MILRILIGAAFVLGVAAAENAQPKAVGLAPAPMAPKIASQLAPRLVTPAPSVPAEPAHELTAADLDAWLDGFVPYAIGRGDIAGAEVVVVKDGAVLFEKGYGVSDVKTQAKVDPKRTLFRPGSISKLFTWTSVMQLVEQHKIDLDADINTYLDFKIPPAYGKPITMRDLMTHRPGFEETIKNLLAPTAKDMVPLREALTRWVPERMFPPGEVPAYSNYGAALAGYIVQRVSGEPFEDYVARHIFAPLHMDHSTFKQPLPKALAGDMSKGYDRASGDPKPYELIPMSPAGGLATTGDDISRFMLAHLNNGSYDGARILEPETAKMMHGIVYPVPAGTLPMGLGFYHEDRNGYDIVGHGGDTIYFHSDLHLILDKGVGFYVTQNSAGKPGLGLRGPLFAAFMDRYFPAPKAAALPTLKTAKRDGALVAGAYEVSRRSDSNMLRIAGVLGYPAVKLNGDGTISIDIVKDLAGNPKKFRETAPFRWQEVNGPSQFIAVVKDGAVQRIYTSDLPPIEAITPAPFLRGAWNFYLFVEMFAMLALTALFWPIKAILRWRYEAPFSLQGREAALYRLSRLAALCDVVFLGGFLALFTYGNENLAVFTSAYDWLFRILQAIGIFGVIGTIAIVWNFLAGLGNAERLWWTKISDLLFAIAGVAFVWFVIADKLITWSLNY
ncbi:MAG: beta-lactamase family protein [Proteobacteria bacterium]|nr:beta-lactamase family protein [Pseudomonadota bacterium]